MHNANKNIASMCPWLNLSFLQAKGYSLTFMTDRATARLPYCLSLGFKTSIFFLEAGVSALICFVHLHIYDKNAD